MIKIITFARILFLFGCVANKNVKVTNQIPSCLRSKVDSMSANASIGAPQSITRYSFHGKTVYYLKLAFCDKYNIVYDSACNLLGFPDGGFTGRGDGKMVDFHREETDGKIVWKKE